MKEPFVWFVGNLLKHLVVFCGWLVCWKYCCLCMLIDVDAVLKNDSCFGLSEILFRCVKK
jgi:hypothetical protein